jgi:outer membrane lipoprotein-sorting protein
MLKVMLMFSHCLQSNSNLKTITNQQTLLYYTDIITGEEVWVYGYDTETKQHTSQQNSPHLLQPGKPYQFTARPKKYLDCLLWL